MISFVAVMISFVAVMISLVAESSLLTASVVSVEAMFEWLVAGSGDFRFSASESMMGERGV